ncbi:MAG: LysR family transcriptional regulator [Gammaproteobacteria bacterium]
MAYPITFRQLEIFASVARHLSITRASEALHLSQPAVSMQLKQLENLAAMPLLEKNGKKIRLTEAGRIVRDYAEKTMASRRVLEETLAALSGAISGRLCLAVPETANQFVTLLLAQFRRQHPGIGFQLKIQNRAELLECLEENTVDLVIMGQPPADRGLVARSFMKNPLVVIAPPDHPLCDRQFIHLSELMQSEFVVREPGSGTRIAMQRFFAEQGFQLIASMEMPNNEAIKQAVAAGLGLGIISLHTLQQELALNQIKILNVEKMPILRAWHVVHAGQKILSPATALFIRFVIENTQRIWSAKYPELLEFI